MIYFVDAINFSFIGMAIGSLDNHDDAVILSVPFTRLIQCLPHRIAIIRIILENGSGRMLYLHGLLSKGEVENLFFLSKLTLVSCSQKKRQQIQY